MSALRNVMAARGRTVSAALLAGGMLTYVAVASAADTSATAAADVTITPVGPPAEAKWVPGQEENVEITTGQTVEWTFPEGGVHNVISTNANANDPRWEPLVFPGPGDYTPAAAGARTEFTFVKAGTYEFLCKIHEFQGMRGTIVVTGPDQPIPTPTATPTPSASPTATATPTPTGTVPPVDDHTDTPAPKPAADTTKPALSGVRLAARKRAAKVTFTLSENATVTLQVRKRGAKKVLRTVKVHASAGKRSVVIRSSKLRKGRYTISLSARDAMGNTSSLSSASLRIRK